jgi:hypothetical protein
MGRLTEVDDEIETNETELDSLVDQIRFYSDKEASIRRSIERLGPKDPPAEKERLEWLAKEMAEKALALRMRHEHLKRLSDKLSLEYRELASQIDGYAPDKEPHGEEDKGPPLKPRKPKR